MEDFNNFTIPLKEAKEWTTQWQRNNPNLSKAFLLPVENLLGCLQEMGVLKIDSDGKATITLGKDQKVRTYIGLDEKKTQKLIMVGTKNENGVYKDLISENEDNNSGIYDFSRPCPYDCDLSSPLNN